MKPASSPPSDHASYVALLDSLEAVHPLPHTLYVALARGEGIAPDYAGQTMTLADWYVRLRNGEPDVVVNETYTPITFDAQGKADWTADVPGTGRPRTRAVYFMRLPAGLGATGETESLDKLLDH